jgi:hypothetical protein
MPVWGFNHRAVVVGAALLALLAGCGGGGRPMPTLSRGKAESSAAPHAAPADAAPPAPVIPARPVIHDPLRQADADSVRFALDLEGPEPIRAMNFYCRKVLLGAEDPLVVILSTSRDEEHPEYPALFFQGELPAGEGRDIAHQTIRGRLFMQQDSQAPVYHTPPGRAATVIFQDIDDDRIRGEIQSVQVMSSENGRAVTVSAEFRASLRAEQRRSGRAPAVSDES